MCVKFRVFLSGVRACVCMARLYIHIHLQKKLLTLTPTRLRDREHIACGANIQLCLKIACAYCMIFCFFVRLYFFLISFINFIFIYKFWLLSRLNISYIPFNIFIYVCVCEYNWNHLLRFVNPSISRTILNWIIDLIYVLCVCFLLLLLLFSCFCSF